MIRHNATPDFAAPIRLESGQLDHPPHAAQVAAAPRAAAENPADMRYNLIAKLANGL